MPTYMFASRFCLRHVDRDPVTLIYEVESDIPKMYLYIKNELPMSRLLKVTA